MIVDPFKYVTTLEQSTKLKELGVKQDSFYCWEDDGDKEYLITRHDANKEGKEWSESCPSAFTVEELIALLPESVTAEARPNMGAWMCRWDGESGQYYEAYGPSEAEARGKMLIHLLESKLI